MPWTKRDYPDAMKNLSEKQRSYAIEIANHVLESTGDDGIAIATGIARAKEKYKSSLKVSLTARE